MNRLCSLFMAILFILALHSLPAAAEILRERYPLPYDASTGTPTADELRRQVKKMFLEDFLRKRLSPKLVNESGDRVDIALDPLDAYLIGFTIVSATLNNAKTEILITVQGEVDTAALVAALVQNKVITFGGSSPKVMFLSGTNSDDQKAAEKLRALVFERIRQAGLQPVVRSGEPPIASAARRANTSGDAERQALLLQAREYGADYLFYINTEADAKTVFGGKGFLTNLNLTYTILRPNGAVILGESVLSAAGQGSTRVEAFDRALSGDGDAEGIAPQFAKKAVGQLYQAIFSDSDVISDTPQADQEKTLALEGATPPVVQAVMANLKASGIQVSLLSGVSRVASRLGLQTSKNDLELYNLLNGKRISADGRSYTLSVFAYSENNFEVEAVAAGVPARRSPIVKPPAPKTQRQTRPDAAPRGPMVLMVKLRDRQY